ncbi:glutamate-rich protein 2 [Arapaima gigas]
MNRTEKYAGPPLPEQQAVMNTFNKTPTWSPPDVTVAEETSRQVSVAQCAARSQQLLKTPGSKHTGSKNECTHADTLQLEMERCPTEQEEDCEKEPPRAPFQLFAEFLKSVMGKDYTQAHELCRSILIYEPENPEAKQFIPLIEEKLKMEQEDGQQEEEEHSDISDENEDITDSSCSNTDSEALSSDSSREEAEKRVERKVICCRTPPLS